MMEPLRQILDLNFDLELNAVHKVEVWRYKRR